MATWTQVRSISAPGNGIFMCDDGTNIYFRDGSDIVKFNPVTLTESVIGNLSSDFTQGQISAGGYQGALTFFKDYLYLLMQANAGGDDLQIWRWKTDGSISWTKVFSSNAFTDTAYGGIFATLTSVVALALDSTSGDLNPSVYSTNGTTWSTATTDGASLWDDFGNPVTSNNNMAAPTFRTRTSSGSARGIFQYTADGVWTQVDSDPSAVFRSTGPDSVYWSFVSGNEDWSTDWISYTSPSDATIKPIHSMSRTPVSIGYKKNSNDMDFYQFASPDWDAGETVYTNASVSTIGYCTRLDDGNVVCWITGTNTLHLRDTPMDAPGPRWPVETVGCRFYFGALAGALQEKFTLPFSGVAPKGMTLDKALGTVVMVADGANSDPVVYSTSPYITGTVTDENFPENAAGVVAKWI